MMDNLPLELVIYIFNFIQPADYMKCCLVCKFWNSLLFNKIKEKWKLYKNKIISPKKLFTSKYNIYTNDLYSFNDYIILINRNKHLNFFNKFNGKFYKHIFFSQIKNIYFLMSHHNKLYIIHDQAKILVINENLKIDKKINLKKFYSINFFLICKLGIVYGSKENLKFYSFNNNIINNLIIITMGNIIDLILDKNNILYIKIKNNYKNYTFYYTINLNKNYINYINYFNNIKIAYWYYYSLPENIEINKDITTQNFLKPSGIFYNKFLDKHISYRDKYYSRKIGNNMIYIEKKTVFIY